MVPEKQVDACGLFGVMDRSRKRFDGNTVIDAMKNMKVRGNGLEEVSQPMVFSTPYTAQYTDLQQYPC